MINWNDYYKKVLDNPTADPMAQQEASMKLKPQQSVTPIALDTADAPETPLLESRPQANNQSLQAQIEKQRIQLEEFHQTELDRVNKQLEEARAKEAEYLKKQEGVMSEADPLTQPFRQSIETSERERLKVEENYFANQALVNELDTLLTESIELTQKLQSQRVPGLAGLQQSSRMIKSQESAQSRIAVIESVMAARNNQIGTALNFIDRTVGQIQADRQDRLSYLSNLFNFYETTRNEEGEKIFNLNREQKEIFDRQRQLLEDDLARTQANADRIKQMMQENPLMVAQSGISLNDTEEQISKKLADWQYSEEVRTMKNTAQENGMQYLTQAQVRQYPSNRIFTQTDSAGKTHQFLIPPETNQFSFSNVEGQLYRTNKTTGAVEWVAGDDSDSDITPITWEEFLSQLDLAGDLDPATEKALREAYNETIGESAVKAKDFFTNTQISKGAAKAGMSLSEFGELSADEANRYITDSTSSTTINPFE